MVDRPTLCITPLHEASTLLLLLSDVVMVGAEGLQLTVPEEVEVALVLDDMVGDEEPAPRVWLSLTCSGAAAVVNDAPSQAYAAEGLGLELLGSPTSWALPSGQVVEVAVGCGFVASALAP